MKKFTVQKLALATVSAIAISAPLLLAHAQTGSAPTASDTPFAAGTPLPVGDVDTSRDPAPAATPVTTSSPIATSTPLNPAKATSTPVPKATVTPQSTVNPAATPFPPAKVPAAPTISPSPTPYSASTPTPKPSPAAVGAQSQLPSITMMNSPTVAGTPSAPDHVDLSLDTQGGTDLTLEKSVHIAIERATEVLKAENYTHYAGTHLLQAYGQFLPSLSANSNYGYTTGRTYSTVATPVYIDGSSKGGGYGLVADLNLFNGLADFSNLRSAILKKDAADLTFERAKQQIGLDVAQAYLQVILDEKLVAITRKNLQASQERERLLQEQTEVGVKNLSDLFRQQAQTSQDESSELQAENKSRTDQIYLLRKVRLDLTEKYHFSEPKLMEGRAPEADHAEKDLVADAIKKRYDLEASNNTADATRWDVHSAFSTYLPRIDLLGTLNGVGHTLDDWNVNGTSVVPANQPSMGNQFGRQIQYTVGVSLTWNLFDRFLTAQNVSQARVVADNAEVDQEDKRLQVQGEVRQAFGDYRTALDQLVASRKGLDAAQKAYEVMNGRYEVGAASFLDLITSQAVLVQAESSRAQALINFQLQDRNLKFVMGRDPY